MHRTEIKAVLEALLFVSDAPLPRRRLDAVLEGFATPEEVASALAPLAIVAYRQPVVRTDIEDVRGVDSGGVLKALLDRKLVRVLGRKDVPGRPLLYGTTPEFLELFGLKDLSGLPTLRELRELEGDARLEAQAEGGEAHGPE